MSLLKNQESANHNETQSSIDCVFTRDDSISIKNKLEDELLTLNKIKVNVPNFLVIGVQKGGTTWLHENLKHHPQILLPNKKELEFFSYYQKKINQDGWSEYLGHLNKIGNLIKTRKNPIAVGEVTPSYFWSTSPRRQWTNPPKDFNSCIPESVFNVLGSKVKIIVCFRNPIDRAISAYLHHIRHNRISFKEQSILDTGHLYGIIDMGFYAQHLEHWLQKFDFDNFQFLIYEQDIKKDKKLTIKKVCDFLTVDYQLYSPVADLQKIHNKGLQYYRNEKGAYLVNEEKSEDHLVVSQEDINKLKHIYFDDVLSLEKKANLDCSLWNFT
jgi:Sulfotransferase domain